MQCPACNETLTIAERQGVEIDFCPKCRGVWLDRGELDKILERDAAIADRRTAPARRFDTDRRPDDDSYRRRDDDDDRYPKRRSIWKELFD